MPQKNIFDKPFEEGTKVKLEIYEKYLRNWLPTFIMYKKKRQIQIFDFFAGRGYDQNHIPGSPIITLNIVNEYIDLLRNNQKKVCLFLNDFDEFSINQLKSNVEQKILEFGIEDIVNVEYRNDPFQSLFKSYLELMGNGFNLIFIDQNGFKEVTEDVFQNLIYLNYTDFLFFISSNYLKRFADEPEVKKYHPNFDFERIKSTDLKNIHNVICHEFEKYIPKDIINFLLIPFSIMKTDIKNVYGVIFVTKHILGADKFLNTVWETNPINGNANFDIDEDLPKAQLSIFEDTKLTKIGKFQIELKSQIMERRLKDNLDVYLFTINNGFVPKHAKGVIEQMKKEKLITYDSRSPLIGYEHYKNNRKLVYKIK